MKAERIARTFRNIRAALAAQLFARWRVCVTWEGRKLTHWARSEPEAREWLACYPGDLSARRYARYETLIQESRRLLSAEDAARFYACF